MSHYGASHCELQNGFQNPCQKRNKYNGSHSSPECCNPPLFFWVDFPSPPTQATSFRASGAFTCGRQLSSFNNTPISKTPEALIQPETFAAATRTPPFSLHLLPMSMLKAFFRQLQDLPVQHSPHLPFFVTLPAPSLPAGRGNICVLLVDVRSRAMKPPNSLRHKKQNASLSRIPLAPDRPREESEV